MNWTTLNFGKHEGKTFPQILCTDPDWFFWAMDNDVFNDKGMLLDEAKNINRKAKNIKIPNNSDGNLVVEYVIHQPTGKFGDFEIIPKSRPQHKGSSPTFRSAYIDMSVPRKIASYDKLGCKTLLRSLKYYVFNNVARLTKKRCEDFFSDDNNFA